MVYDRFDVDDSDLRESFLRRTVPHAIHVLDDAFTPRWGRMSSREMVEHLVWAFELSTGQAHTECVVPEAELPRTKKFLYSNRPMPREFMNPALRDGLPPLRYADLADAKAALLRELERFLDGRASHQLYTHPVFGAIGHEEWHRSHYKHTHHHLLQFGLIESAPSAA